MIYNCFLENFAMSDFRSLSAIYSRMSFLGDFDSTRHASGMKGSNTIRKGGRMLNPRDYLISQGYNL